MVLKDDEFAEYCSLSILMNELDTLLETTNTYWAEAADGGMPIPVAAWLSTTVFHAVARIFTRYSTIAPSYDVLMEKWFKHREIWPWRIRFRDIPALSKEEGPCWDGIALWYYGKLLSDCRTQKEYEKIVPTAGSRQTPQMLIPNPATTSYRDVAEYDNAMDKMQESMRLGLVEKRGIRKLEPAGALQYVCEPLLPVLASALANKNDPVPFHLVFGYEMLLSSFKTHLWRNPRQNCRLAALRLAMEVKSEAEKAADPALFNCKCTAKNCILCTMQWGLADTASRLDAYVREVRFDLYYQAPWTAGCHMVETLVFARYEGLNLCLSSGIVAALLHLYNALVHVSPAMPRVKLLDDFCALFKEQVFLGTLPMDNFSSHFRRAMGGKLSKPGSEDGPSSPSSSRIALPTKAQLTHAIKPGSSLFYDMHNFSFAPTPAIWTRAYLGPGTAATSAKKQRDVLDLVHTAPFNVPLGKLGDAVMSEFTGSQPMMRINYFAIHSFCARVMRALDEALLYGSKVHGVHIVDDLLGGIMRHLGDDGARRVLRFWGPMVCVKRVFGEVDGQRGMEGFLWRV
ncbi:hypothetical protein P153DRAFT_68283 [Dothidotthia symphoricarpi CBS 119687]|uniref:Uncharacterized protein n=1 Tax=Dothidotthia symphoricarpi CBS 119687 TaxID=1392245 RepID=A0A6A6A7R9_9PLEO|nr:uncharacterized protein P153DRAFT_68283 [Dothidotthia symphoricarpi CBS 119687]KAF2126701.1 hypothetical protein P153DRAFT_68283 [Dothidotthia symphoricarpi CBS 119687]